MNLERVLNTLIRFEGLKTLPYFDCCGKFFRDCTCKKQGKLTGGIGRNLEDQGVTPAEAKFLARNDMGDAVKAAYRHVPDFGKHDDVRREIIVMMLFQLGAPRFLEFQNMLAAFNRGDYATAAMEMRNSKWAKEDCPGRASELATMMATGRYSGAT